MVRAMFRLTACAVAVAAVACGTTDDSRPLDAEYITAAVLAPTCGAANCHSTFTQNRGDVFDTLEGMRASIVNNGLVVLDSTAFDPASPSDAALIQWVTKIDPFNLGIGRMPLDAAMPNADIFLLERWITGKVQKRDDATPCSPQQACPVTGDTCDYSAGGATGNCVNIMYESPAKGAQCNPVKNGGMACFGRERVQCNSDWNFGNSVEMCANDCVSGVCI